MARRRQPTAGSACARSPAPGLRTASRARQRPPGQPPRRARDGPLPRSSPPVARGSGSRGGGRGRGRLRRDRAPGPGSCASSAAARSSTATSKRVGATVPATPARRSSSIARSIRRASVAGATPAPKSRAPGRSKSRSRKCSRAARGRISAAPTSDPERAASQRRWAGRLPGPVVPRTPGGLEAYGILSIPLAGSGGPRPGANGGPMAEILTESFCERCGTRYTFQAAEPRRRGIGPDPHAHARREELRRERQRIVRRGNGGRARGRRTHCLRPAVGRVPRDVQLLHELSSIHLPKLLEQQCGRMPVMCAGPEPRGPPAAVPAPCDRGWHRQRVTRARMRPRGRLPICVPLSCLP